MASFRSQTEYRKHTNEQKEKLLKIAQELAKLSAQHRKLSIEHDQLLDEMGFKIEHDGGNGFHDDPTFPDWYVDKIDYGGKVTSDDINRLLSELKKKEVNNDRNENEK